MTGREQPLGPGPHPRPPRGRSEGAAGAPGVAAPDRRARLPDHVVAWPQAAGQEIEKGEKGRTDDRPERRDDVGEDAEGEHDGRPSPIATRPLPVGDEPDEDQRQRDAEGVRVLAGQGGEEVPPVDGVRVVEEEGERGRGQRRRDGRAQAEEPSAGPRGDRQGDRAEDRRPLEGDVVGDDPSTDGRQGVGEDEVEGVDGKPVVPGGIPAGEVPVRDQALEERRHHVVGARVAAGGRRVRQEQREVHLPEDDADHGPDRDDRPRSGGAATPSPAARRELARRSLRQGRTRRHHRGDGVSQIGHLPSARPISAVPPAARRWTTPPRGWRRG